MTDRFQDRPGRSLRIPVQRREHPVLSEHPVVPVRRLGQAVRVKEQLVPRLKPDLIFRIGHTVHSAYDESVSVPEQREAAVLHQRGVLVTRVGGRDPAGADLQNAEPYRNKHLHLVVRAQALVRFCEDLRGALPEHRAGLYDHLRDHHEQGSRYPLPADVRDQQGQVILVDQEEIVKIPADHSRRFHGREDVEFLPLRERRERLRQHAPLDTSRHVQLRFDALLL